MAYATIDLSLLGDEPFTIDEALAVGVTVAMLRGWRFRRLFRGVYVLASVELTQSVWLAAALKALPSDAVVSHVSALWLYGVEIGSPWPLHLSTNTTAVTKLARVRLHRRRGRLTPHEVVGLPATGPDRAFVDAATCLGFVQLVQAGDWLLHAKATDLCTLTEYAHERHLDGVIRARRVLAFVRDGVESPRETTVRLMIIFARLPEPACNLNILDSYDRFIARGDMVYVRWKVVVEYDGWGHERSAKQRQRDRERREHLEAEGWRVIVITSEDLKNAREIVRRVYAALRDRGYEGAPPHTNVMWTKWFA